MENLQQHNFITGRICSYKSSLSCEMKDCPKIYHEKQSRQLCALHTLNNLLQKPDAFTKAQLDELCLRLSPDTWINPHRSFFGLGNYDINVIMAALQMAGHDVIWWDKRRKITSEEVDRCFGFILNLPSQSRVGGLFLPFKTKHWVALRRFDSKYYDLDSKLESPRLIGNSRDLIDHLTAHLMEDNCELFIVNSKVNDHCPLAEPEENSASSGSSSSSHICENNK
nr:EOG090X0HOM [Ilyocryptus agilis]